MDPEPSEVDALPDDVKRLRSMLGAAQEAGSEEARLQFVEQVLEWSAPAVDRQHRLDETGRAPWLAAAQGAGVPSPQSEDGRLDWQVADLLELPDVAAALAEFVGPEAERVRDRLLDGFDRVSLDLGHVWFQEGGGFDPDDPPVWYLSLDGERRLGHGVDLEDIDHGLSAAVAATPWTAEALDAGDFGWYKIAASRPVAVEQVLALALRGFAAGCRADG